VTTKYEKDYPGKPKARRIVRRKKKEIKKKVIGKACSSTVKYSDGHTFTGCVDKNGTEQGKGTLTDKFGTKISAYFSRGKANGPGIQIWFTGEKYEGLFVDGKAEGSGIKIYPSNDKF